MDAIVASGFEAGGHRGAFLRRAEDSLIGTMSLVPQVVDAVKVPVIAAGGIADARGVMAALALGAEGVQIGTAFLASEESGANPLHRAALRGPAARDTGLTRGFSGRLARGIRNRLMEELNRDGTPTLPYPSAARADQECCRRRLSRRAVRPDAALGRTECGTIDQPGCRCIPALADREGYRRCQYRSLRTHRNAGAFPG